MLYLQDVAMDVRSDSKAYEHGQGDKESTSRKRRRALQEGEAEGSEVGGRRVVDKGEEVAENDTSSRSDYMLERSETGGSDNERQSLEMESANCSEWGGAGSREGRNTGRGKRRSVIADVDAVWRSFEKQGLMDSSGSEFKGGVASGGESSAEVSFGEESEGRDEGERSQEEGRRHRRTHR